MRAGRWITTDRNGSAERESAFAQSEQTERVRSAQFIVGDAAPVVRDVERQRVRVHMERHSNAARLGVFCHVVQGFLQHTEDGRGDGIRRGGAVAVDVEIESDASPRGKLVRLPFDRIGQAELIEDTRPELGDDAPYGDHYIVEPGEQAGAAPRQLRRGLPTEATLHPRQIELEPRERLTQLVVQLASDACALFLADGLESRGERSQLLTRARDFFRRPVTIRDVALNPHVSDDSPELIVGAEVMPFDSHWRAIHAPFVRLQV